MDERDVQPVITPATSPESHRYRFSDSHLPQVGGQKRAWHTTSGYVEGVVVAAQVGGPYVIDTPQGKVEVRNIR